MRFTDYTTSYNELYPQAPKTKPVKVIETPVGNVVEEVHEEVKEVHEEETPVILEEQETVENGNGGSNQGISE